MFPSSPSVQRSGTEMWTMLQMGRKPAQIRATKDWTEFMLNIWKQECDSVHKKGTFLCHFHLFCNKNAKTLTPNNDKQQQCSDCSCFYVNILMVERNAGHAKHTKTHTTFCEKVAPLICYSKSIFQRSVHMYMKNINYTFSHLALMLSLWQCHQKARTLVLKALK